MNNLLEVIEVFDKIASTSSTIEKQNIIKGHKNNELFKLCLKFLLDDMIVTGISDKKYNKGLNLHLSLGLIHNVEELLKYVQLNNTGRDEDIIEVKSYIESNYEPIYSFLKGLVCKSLKLGANSKLVNKAFGYNFIPVFNVMLAESYDKHKGKIKNSNFILTTKLDGSRIIAIREGNKVLFYTRQGKPMEQLIELEKDFMNLPEGVYDGELLALGEFNNAAEQYKETMKRSRIKGVKTGLKMVCYDYIEDIDSFFNGIDNTPCIDRKSKLEMIIKSSKDDYNIEHIEYLYPLYIGKDKSMIEKYSNEAVSKGDEGIMLSIADSSYKCSRTHYLQKVKLFKTADVYVDEVLEGEGRLSGTLGKIKISYLIDGEKHSCYLGSGFSDSDRSLIWNNPELIINKVVTIKFFEISENDNGGKGLRFPTWISMDSIRDDKSSLEDTNID